MLVAQLHGNPLAFTTGSVRVVTGIHCPLDSKCSNLSEYRNRDSHVTSSYPARKRRRASCRSTKSGFLAPFGALAPLGGLPPSAPPLGNAAASIASPKTRATRAATASGGSLGWACRD